jgi:D-alanyl-D-alanine carboxypeptidase
MGASYSGSRVLLPRSKRAFTMALALLIALPVLGTVPAAARKHTVRHAARHKTVRMPASPTDPAKDAAMVIDGATGKVLYARNETAERHPASLTKMMTLYLLFDALKHGKVTMDTPLPVSRHASVQKPTKLWLKPGQTISVDTAIRAIVIRSANDVAAVIAEALGGTESHFGVMMTERARQMGMRETNFHNASGLPDPLQITTAADLAVLARHLAYDFPQYFGYFALPGFTYKGTWYPTHDNLIGKYDGADGIKTGYTGASGFNLVSSVVRGRTHLIAVVMGGRTAVRRDAEMMRLLDQTFAQVATNPTLVAQATVPWHKGEPAGGPVLASLAQPSPGSRFENLSGIPAIIQTEDEDAAESARAPDEIAVPAPRPAAKPAPAVATAVTGGLAVASATQAKPAAKAPDLKLVVPAARPTPRPVVASAAPAATPAVRVASNVPLPRIRPSVRDDVGEGDVDSPAPEPGKNWTIQIGAYADRGLASAQLASYAGKAQDVLARATRIIDPIQAASGHTLYRARFGLFAEQEARDVCSRLTQRGQTCFAAVQAR